MDYSDKWLGVAGAGFGFSVIGGVGVYQINLFNMGGSPVPIRALIVGKRLGVTLQAETAHCVCLLTGVRSPDQLTEIKSSGMDWALAFGFKADSFLKTGSKVAKALIKMATHGGNWASHETSKKLVQGLMGDFSVDPKGPSFVLLPTPAALGIGAGLWYEWQKLTKTGSDIAWEYVKPSWRLVKSRGRVLLEMTNIPEADGTQLNFHVRRKMFGPDDLIKFSRRANAPGEQLLTGIVRGGRLYDAGGAQATEHGFDISSLYPVGHRTIGMLAVGDDSKVAKNTAIEIGVSVCKGRINLYKWSSDDYVKVGCNGEGRFVDAPDSTVKD